MNWKEARTPLQMRFSNTKKRRQASSWQEATPAPLAVCELISYKLLIIMVAGSIPDEVIFLNLRNSSGRTRPWGLLSL
jgi:hypothetical protein